MPEEAVRPMRGNPRRAVSLRTRPRCRLRIPSTSVAGVRQEYCFVLVKGKIRKDIQLLCDKPNKWAGHTNWGKISSYDKNGKVAGKKEKINPVPEFSKRNNIWKYNTAVEVDKNTHPAKMPEKLAVDHVLSWSVEGDIVFDPFMGSGTTGKAAMANGRDFIGVEIVTEYCEITKERFDKYGFKNKDIYVLEQ